MFSAFGVDTLKEVKVPARARLQTQAAPAAGPDAGRPSAAGAARTGGESLSWPTYQDMHDWGDALSAAGFADPVMDVEHLTLTYEDRAKFWKDAGSLSMMRRLRDDAELAPSILPGVPSSGPLSLSIEVIYGHAWCPRVKRRADGLATVQIHPPGASYNRKR
jgi:malonyl-CoA O-methyltransferase